MNDTEIMNNEVIETTEEVIENIDTSKGTKVAGIIGLSIIAGIITYKYVSKPVITNIRTRIEQKKMAAEEQTIILDESDVEEDD